MCLRPHLSVRIAKILAPLGGLTQHVVQVQIISERESTHKDRRRQREKQKARQK
ncbi:hypothetical protein EXN66_Car001272 [Channa argus]|uniref:Uncharacterized protein n=1 Tax=Channa argus TaxID=215402 RepID=A0A6G1R0N9_CHAAH|nr:hypothetical protein EXN66_Car001272 [Channa argus]